MAIQHSPTHNSPETVEPPQRNDQTPQSSDGSSVKTVVDDDESWGWHREPTFPRSTSSCQKHSTSRSDFQSRINLWAKHRGAVPSTDLEDAIQALRTAQEFLRDVRDNCESLFEPRTEYGEYAFRRSQLERRAINHLFTAFLIGLFVALFGALFVALPDKKKKTQVRMGT